MIKNNQDKLDPQIIRQVIEGLEQLVIPFEVLKKMKKPLRIILDL